jgi:hypothetical protein
MVELMTAREAATQTKSFENEGTKRQLETIKDAIDLAVSQSKFSAYVNFYPNETVKQELTKLGYTVSSCSGRNETTTSISWNPKETFSNGGYR